MKWRLPESLNIGGKDYRIRTDFRDILTILDACTASNPRQPGQEEMEKLLKCCYYDTEVDF